MALLRRRNVLTVLVSLSAMLAGPSAASAAEAGVNIGAGSATQFAAMRTLGTHWARMFVQWPQVEPARGSYNELWFSAYEKLYAELPPGTKVILDMVDTPSW